MPRKAPRIPADHREPAEPWLLLKQIELSTQPDAVRVHLLVDEVGLACIARGILPGYVQQQAQDALIWCAVDARLPAHLKPAAGKLIP